MTQFLAKANNATSTLQQNISNAQVVMQIQDADIPLFPANPAIPFEVTLWPQGQDANDQNCEIVLVTAGQGTGTWTITRAQEQTVALPFASNDNVALFPTAKHFTDIENTINNTTGTGSYVLSDTPVVNTPTIITPIVITELDNGTQSGNYAVDWTDGDRQRITASGDLAISFQGAASGQILTLWAYEDGVGGHNITFTNPITWYPANVPPILITTARHVNAFSVRFDGVNYFGSWETF